MEFRLRINRRRLDRFLQPKHTSPGAARRETQPGERHESVGLYQAGLGQYQSELNAINQRNSAFVVAQSIFLGALVTFLVNSTANFPYALVGVIWAIATAGSLFCLINFRATNASFSAAAYWKTYLASLSPNLHGAPSPPTVGSPWGFTTALFASGWLASLGYITLRLFLNEEKNPLIEGLSKTPLWDWPWVRIFQYGSIALCVLSLANVVYIFVGHLMSQRTMSRVQLADVRTAADQD